jgi:error-prone DNA polymerase
VPSTPPYAELHCHSAYSFLDGVSLPDELAFRAAELGYESLALTDHNSVSGSMELAQVAPEYGLRAIHGAEVDVLLGGRGADPVEAGSGHLTLLVRDERGWRNLCRILTLAHAHTRDAPSSSAARDPGAARAKIRRRLRSATGLAPQPALPLGALLEHAQGLVCLTGCASRSLLLADARAGAPGGGADAVAREGDQGVAARLLLDAFGPENLYVELQRPYARDDRARNRALSALARRLGVRCVASGDVHAHARCRAELQDAFVALRNHATLDASEPLRRGNHSHVMTTPQAMASRFADHPEAVRETLVLAEQLTFDLGRDLGYRYPGAEDAAAARRLSELCAQRLHERYGAGSKGSAGAPRGTASLREAQARLESELAVIEQLGLAGFFLLHHDMLELAREVAVEVRGPDSVRAMLAPGRGRGSSVSSLVCYLTGLSHIDPIAGRLALGRFLHEELSGLPDIDLDFPRDIRERLIPRVHERYGTERSALVAAFPTYRERGAIRELGKVLGLPAGEIERLARGAERYGPELDGGSTGSAPLGEVPESATGLAPPGVPLQERAGTTQRSPRWRWLARLVEQARGLPRHLSQHPGGMIIATRPLIDCCPIVPAAMEGRQMVQWDKDSCADAGFLKIDLLGLGMLSAVERCVEEVARTRGERIDLSRIPYDDPATYRAIRAADTVGVFQIESRAQMQSLLRTRPANLEDITIQVAIVRPGPIQGGAVNPYIKRRQRLRADPSYEIPYEHPALEPVLRETLGTIIFQDQVMQVAEAFAGFSPGEADGLRRAMSRKRSRELLAGQRERFIAGAREHSGADEETAARVWSMVEGFAGFGFPKAHSAAFGLLAYQSTWLRVHYGAEFLCALMNEQPMGFYAPDSLVHEAQHRGITILGLDVNASEVLCVVQDGCLRLGLAYIKGIAESEAHALVSERERSGPYRSLDDLVERAGVRSATLEQLAWSGACDGLQGLRGEGRNPTHADRREALWRVGLAVPAETAPGGDSTQLALALEHQPTPALRPLGRWQRLIADYSTSGVTVGDHAIAVLRERLVVPSSAGRVVLATSAQLARLPTGSDVAIAGLVIARQRPGTAGGTMFLLFEDEFGTVNLIVSRAVYERRRLLARAEPLLLARGRLERTQEPTLLAPSSHARSLGAPAPGEEVRPVINVIVRELTALEAFLPGGIDGTHSELASRVHTLRSGQSAGAGDAGAEELDAVAVGSSMRAVAPPIQSFASGRRR